MVEQLDELYREVILDHFKSSSRRGDLPKAQIKAVGNNPLCGDELTFFLKLDDGQVRQARFNGKGCAISMAAASMLTEYALGKSLDEVAKFNKQDALNLINIPISCMRLKCALLGLKVLKLGVLQFMGKKLEAEDEN